LVEVTGPENVVEAMISPYAQVACQSVHRPLGRSDKLGFAQIVYDIARR
jgi:hypothetical protein